MSHYGFGAFESLWNRNYRQILEEMDASDKIVCLSEKVKVTYSKYISASKLLVSPNGSSFEPVTGRDSLAPLVCVGKVESRKLQFELWKVFQSSERKIIFIGPITDTRVMKALKTNKDNKNFFVGPKSRDYLAQNMHKFSGLILLSLGKEDALVLYEAQLVGLPVFVTKNGLGSQNVNLNWINLIPQNPEPAQIELIPSNLNTSTSEIYKYARQYYSWSVRSQPLLKELLFQAKFFKEKN